MVKNRFYVDFYCYHSRLTVSVPSPTVCAVCVARKGYKNKLGLSLKKKKNV